MSPALHSLLIYLCASTTAISAEGYFRIEQRAGKWLLLDPEGHPFFMRGVNHFSDGSDMPWNLEEKFGDDAVKWRASVAQRQQEWGFNYLPPSVGPSHRDPSLVQGIKTRESIIRDPTEWQPEWFAELQMPFTIFLEVPKHYMSPPKMGDVFGRDFIDVVEAKCAKVCGALRDNRQLIGYHFCHNPPWNITAPTAEHWLTDCTRPGSAGLKAWTLLMQQVYGSIERWRETYGVPIKAWSDIEKLGQPLNGYVSKSRALEDKEAFLQRICDQWHRVYHAAIRRHDPHHLILGDRNTLHLQPAPSPWAYHIMRRYLDVLSVNVMGTRRIVEMRLETASRHWDGPIHLADTGAAIYEGEPSKAGFRSSGIAEYEQCYTDLMHLGLDHPQVIGFGWCGWFEIPHPGGRTGLVDVQNDSPIPERVTIVKKWNEWMAAQPAWR
jgi:hypothetical protein